MKYTYQSSFTPSDSVVSLLHRGKIMDPSESPADMVSRVVSALGEQERAFVDDTKKADAATDTFGHLVDEGSIVLSTPILTNAGRYTDRPLSACILPPISLREDADYLKLKVDELHQQGMGTGFNLSETADPVHILKLLNDIAVEGSKSGLEQRPVGNMAIISVYHPRIIDFITAKKEAPRKNEEWKFNISVDLDSAFFTALHNNQSITLQDGTTLDAQYIFQELCEAAHACADPGIIFLERMNKRNPVPALGTYKATAPCAEVGLAEGEACQFGYINVGNFIKNIHTVDPLESVDFDALEKAVQLLTRFLDDALEISIQHYASLQTQEIMRNKRKIGVGLCGVADAISRLGLSYSSAEARQVMTDILAFINYTSKVSSLELAAERGSCEAMAIKEGNRYYETPAFLTSLYGNKTARTVGKQQWEALDKKINDSGLLRNTSTVALPPTGRSALVVEASPGIEPHFTLEGINQSVSSAMVAKAKQSTQQIHLESYLAVARVISPLDHIHMAAALQTYTDEAISKTINLPKGTKVSVVKEIYLKAWEEGLNGATLYIDDTHSQQPRTLS